MTWKIINNSESVTNSSTLDGKCPRFGKIATVTTNFVGNLQCKTDLQKTYHRSGIKCSLLDGTSEASFSFCMENCPLVSDK